MIEHAQPGEVGYTVYDRTTGEGIGHGFLNFAADRMASLGDWAVCTDLDFRAMTRYSVYNPITSAVVASGLTLHEAENLAARDDLDIEVEGAGLKRWRAGLYGRLHAKRLAARGSRLHDCTAACLIERRYLRSRWYHVARGLPDADVECGDEILITDSSVTGCFPANHKTSQVSGRNAVQQSRLSRWRIAERPSYRDNIWRASARVVFVADEGFDTSARQQERRELRFKAIRAAAAVPPPAASCNTSGQKPAQVLQPKTQQDVVKSLRRTPMRPARPPARLSIR